MPDDSTSDFEPDGTATFGPAEFPFLGAPQRPDELGRLGDDGRFRLHTVLGTGAMGAVFAATDTKLGRVVAIKALHPHRNGPAAQEQFLREARAQAAVEHDNIVPIYDVIRDGDLSYIAMPLLKGRTLPAKKSPPAFVLSVGRQVALGLAAAHDRGLIHRDIKPTNLWVEESGRVRVLDFGLASGVVDAAGRFAGTPLFASPEQARGEPLDARTDLFSLGVVLYVLCTGKNPFRAETVDGILERVRTHAPPPPPDVPAPLAELVMRLTAKDRAARPSSAAEVAAELARIEAVPRPRVLLYAGGALVAVAVALAFLLKKPTRPETPPPDPPAVAKPDSPPAPPVASAPLGESVARFEYVVNGEKKRGECRVLTLPVGSPPVPMEFALVPKGSFRMGSPAGEPGGDKPEWPAHTVTISKDFFLGRFEVTQEQFAAVLGKRPSVFRGENLPVEQVSWDDASAFCAALSASSGRRVALPTEAEWEYACRAGTATPFSFGTALYGDLANCNGKEPYGTKDAGPWKSVTVPVGSYPANPWGLHDMHGNVYEWVRDKMGGDYTYNPRADPFYAGDPSNPFRVRRGGSWYEPPKLCRAASRHWWTANNREGNQNGFRVALYPE